MDCSAAVESTSYCRSYLLKLKFKSIIFNAFPISPLHAISLANSPRFDLQKNISWTVLIDRLCDLVVRVLGYRSGDPGSITGTNRKKKNVLGLERGPLSLVSTTEELLDRKVADPV
jgi:hypothetical protein